MKKTYRNTDGIRYRFLNAPTYILRPAILGVSLISKKYKGFAKKIMPEENSAKMSFGVLADVHLIPKHWRTGKLCEALFDMERAKAPLDALTIAGDITDHGHVDQWDRVQGVFAEFPSIKPVLAIGNHDSWGEDSKAKKGKTAGIETYVKYRNEICKETTKKPYYSVDVKGYKIICMATEYECRYAGISDAQIAWLQAELETATEGGKPAFVLCHEALNETHGLPRTFGDSQYDIMCGGMGERSEEIKAILQSFKNVFLFSGHSHMGLHNPHATIGQNHGTFEEIGGLTSVNLPCFMFKNHDGKPNSGIGIIVDVYEDKVRLRARSHIWRVWYKSYSYIKLLD